MASSADSLALRTGKFALSSLVPVVGGPLSEAMNGMTNALALVKSCVGSLSLVGLFFLFAPTLLELAVWSALLSAGEFSADFLGVAGQKALFSTLAGLLKFCLATLSATAAFFLLGVGMLFLQSA